MADKYYEGVGRRKNATARVRVMNGSGEITVNGKGLEEYFNRLGDVKDILRPFEATQQDRSQFDVSVMVNGGGVSGQTDAVKLGLTRALIELSPEFRPLLRKAGLLTVDARVKERKKPGLKRARKAPTYTKR